MNFYVSVINEVIEYIECYLGERIQLSDLSARSGISDFHFNRMFKTVTGTTLKQYILGRKLTNSMEQLMTTNKSIIDIALELGFEYPEVFSRAFKKQFGVSPTNFRLSHPLISGTPKACIIERDIINYRGSLALRGNSVLLEPFTLVGIYNEVNTNAEDFKQFLKSQTEDFVSETTKLTSLHRDKFYTVVSCSGNETGDYSVFCGRKPIQETKVPGFKECLIPGGWYVLFIYQGDMFDIREIFIDDLYKWIMVKEAEINANGIGMLNIYGEKYAEDNTVQILVPIKKPI